MQARAVVVAVQIGVLECKVPEGMCPVHDDLDSAPPPQLDNRLDGENLPVDVRDVADQDDLRLRGDVLLEQPEQLLRVVRWSGNGERLEDNPLAQGALPERVEHARVVVAGAEDLVPAFEIHPVEIDFQRFAGVAGNGQFLRIASERFRQTPAHGLDLRIKHRP